MVVLVGGRVGLVKDRKVEVGDIDDLELGAGAGAVCWLMEGSSFFGVRCVAWNPGGLIGPSPVMNPPRELLLYTRRGGVV